MAPPIRTAVPVSARRRLRVLFFSEAVTLAHLARPLALATALPPLDYEVRLAVDPRYSAFLPSLPSTPAPLRSITPERFMESLAQGKPLYDEATLRDYVEQDLAVITDVEPDVVVGDFRLSLSVSARLAGKPYISLSNAYWSPYAVRPFVVPDLPLVRTLGVPVAQGLFSLIRPFAFALHAKPLNRVRSRYGLPALGPNLLRVYTDADITLYADIPELFPLRNAPPTHRHAGAVLWSPGFEKPSWWETLPPERPCVFLSLGSSGQIDRLPMILEALKKLPINVMVATAGRTRNLVAAENVFLADFLPGSETAARASLVICNGGSPMTQLALTQGVPVLGICSNMDQHLNMGGVVRARAGISLRSGTLNPGVLQRSVQLLMAESAYQDAAQGLQAAYGRFRAERQLRSAIASLVGHET